MSNSLWTRGLRHARLPCPSLSPEVSQIHVHWVSDAIQPSHPLPSPSPPALSLSQHQGLFQCQFSPSGGQSIGASASASVLPMIIQDWFPLGLTGLISVQSKGLWGVFSSTIILCNIHAFYIVTCILSCKNRIASLCPTQDTACLGLVHSDDLERCYEEGGGRGVHVWERM